MNFYLQTSKINAEDYIYISCLTSLLLWTMFLSPDQAMLNVVDSQVMQVFIVNCLKKIANSQSTVAQRRKTKTHNLKPQVVHHKIELEPSQASR